MRGISSPICLVYRDDNESNIQLDCFKISDKVVNNLRYADDTVILCESEEQLQQLIDVVVTEIEKKGLYLNSAKSFTMVFSNAKVNPTYESPSMEKI